VFYRFIYHNYQLKISEINDAIKKVKKLNYKAVNIGGRNFQKLYKITGFWNALKIKSLTSTLTFK
jgi:hypothetical protein